MQGFKTYKALVRIVGSEELDAIESGDVDGLGHQIVDTTMNTFDSYDPNKNYMYFYVVDIEARNLVEAKQLIRDSKFGAVAEEEVGQALKYMLKEKTEVEPDKYGLFCTIMEADKYDELIEDNQIIEGDGYYETPNGENLEVTEVIVEPEVIVEEHENGNTLGSDIAKIESLSENTYDKYHENRPRWNLNNDEFNPNDYYNSDDGLGIDDN